MTMTKDVETVYNKNREELSKNNITINNFERFVDKLESFIGQFDETINGSNLRAVEIRRKIDISEKTVSKIDWEGSNIWRDMYRDLEKGLFEFELQNDYRRQWVLFHEMALKKLVELLTTIRNEYDEVAVIKAEKQIVDEKFGDIKKEILERIDNARKNISEEFKIEAKKIADATYAKIPEAYKPIEFPKEKKEEVDNEIETKEYINVEPTIANVLPQRSQKDMLKEGYLELVTSGNFLNLGDLMKKLNMGPNFDKNHGALRAVIRQLVFEGSLPETHKMGEKLSIDGAEK